MRHRFDPRRPAPTAFRSRNRTRQLVLLVAVVQLILGGLDGFLAPWSKLVAWWAAAIAVGIATDRIERFIEHKRSILR